MKKFLHISFIFIAFMISGHYFCSGKELNNYNNSSINNISRIKYNSYLDSDTIIDSKFTIYVSQGILNIKYPVPQELEDGEVVIFNMLGQVITRKKLENSPLNQVNLPNHNTCYIVRISYSGKVYTQKIILSIY